MSVVCIYCQLCVCNVYTVYKTHNTHTHSLLHTRTHTHSQKHNSKVEWQVTHGIPHADDNDNDNACMYEYAPCMGDTKGDDTKAHHATVVAPAQLHRMHPFPFSSLSSSLLSPSMLSSLPSSLSSASGFAGVGHDEGRYMVWGYMCMGGGRYVWDSKYVVGEGRKCGYPHTHINTQKLQRGVFPNPLLVQLHTLPTPVAVPFAPPVGMPPQQGAPPQGPPQQGVFPTKGPPPVVPPSSFNTHATQKKHAGADKSKREPVGKHRGPQQKAPHPSSLQPPMQHSPRPQPGAGPGPPGSALSVDHTTVAGGLGDGGGDHDREGGMTVEQLVSDPHALQVCWSKTCVIVLLVVVFLAAPPFSFTHTPPTHMRYPCFHMHRRTP